MAYFPNGIDDALPVYFKHMEEGGVTVAQLRRRMSWLAKIYPGMTVPSLRSGDAWYCSSGRTRVRSGAPSPGRV